MGVPEKRRTRSSLQRVASTWKREEQSRRYVRSVKVCWVCQGRHGYKIWINMHDREQGLYAKVCRMWVSKMTSSSFPLLVLNPKPLPIYKYLFEFDFLYHIVRILKRKFYFWVFWYRWVTASLINYSNLNQMAHGCDRCDTCSCGCWVFVAGCRLASGQNLASGCCCGGRSTLQVVLVIVAGAVVIAVAKRMKYSTLKTIVFVKCVANLS